jgi:hypothetical protein
MKRRISFADLMMLSVAIPLILAWLFFACYIIYSGINDETGFVQENLDFYVSLIAIIGGPALLFISSILDTWKGEQSAELNALPDRLQAQLNESEARLKNELEIEKLHHTHDVEMDAFKTTGKTE